MATRLRREPRAAPWRLQRGRERQLLGGDGRYIVKVRIGGALGHRQEGDAGQVDRVVNVGAEVRAIQGRQQDALGPPADQRIEATELLLCELRPAALDGGGEGREGGSLHSLHQRAPRGAPVGRSRRPRAGQAVTNLAGDMLVFGSENCEYQYCDVACPHHWRLKWMW